MRAVVADDIMLIRSGVARLLSDAGVEVVGEAGNAETLLRLVALERPDVAVVDIRMPPTHTDEGLAAARTIRDSWPETSVVVLSQYLEPRYAQRLLADQPGPSWLSPEGARVRHSGPDRCHAPSERGRVRSGSDDCRQTDAASTSSLATEQIDGSRTGNPCLDGRRSLECGDRRSARSQ